MGDESWVVESAQKIRLLHTSIDEWIASHDMAKCAIGQGREGDTYKGNGGEGAWMIDTLPISPPCQW